MATNKNIVKHKNNYSLHTLLKNASVHQKSCACIKKCHIYACQKIEGPRNVNFEKSKFKVWSDCVQNSVFIFGGQKSP